MIRLTKLADYGIVLLAHVAGDPRPESFTAREIAEETLVPLPTVTKILKILAQNGLLDSQRGSKGGYSLGRPAELITVADVVHAMDGPIAITECVGDTSSECLIELGCPVRSRWQRINDAVIDALSKITILDMAESLPPRHGRIQIELPKEEPVEALVG
jgi:FeS assembly SUF system regulator